jgi:hypothetical protein
MKWLVVALALGCGHASTPPAGDPSAPDPEARDTCTKSEECTLVDACCGCNAGGRRVAIRKDYVATYDAGRAKRCAHSMCAQHVSTDVSCDAEAVCNALNRCVVQPHQGHDNAIQ